MWVFYPDGRFAPRYPKRNAFRYILLATLLDILKRLYIQIRSPAQRDDDMPFLLAIATLTLTSHITHRSLGTVITIVQQEAATTVITH